MKVTAKSIRYIKLGRKGRWEKISLDRNELHLGHVKIPHELARTKNYSKITQHRIDMGKSSRAASDDAREIMEFYSLGRDCLWITFAKGHMWWTFADPEVTWIGGNEESQGQRIRRCIGGWKNTDVSGNPLTTETLSTRLTKVASYRRTICSVSDEEYVLRRINGTIEPLILKSNNAREKYLKVLEEAIGLLRGVDFETFVDLIFARSGWSRATILGGNQKLIDAMLEHPVTGEKCAVQVKSAAPQRVLDKFISDADETGKFDRLFFVCHTQKITLQVKPDRSDVHVWSANELSQTAFRLGLADWIIEKVT